MAASHRTDVDGVLFPDALYTTRGITKAIGVGQHTLAEWIKHGKLVPLKVGRSYGFMGRDVIDLIKRETTRLA